MTRTKAQTWTPLREGDLVDLIAPGFACTPEALDGAIRFLMSWGLKPRVPKQIFGRDVLSANTDELRMRHLRDALLAEDSKAIWCLRGGYGSIRLLPELAKLKKPKSGPKLFIGLSDVTSINVYLNQVWGWPTVHGPLLDRLGKGKAKPQFVREIRKLVFGELPEISFPKLKPLNSAAAQRGAVRAPVTGGNLITLQSSMGTPFEWKTSGRILFFEDIGERGYRVDRVLEQFRQAGFYRGVKAIVFGDFTEGLEHDGRSKVPAVLSRFAESMKIPVFSGVQSGHDVIQRPLPLGTASELRLGERGELICKTGAKATTREESQPYPLISGKTRGVRSEYDVAAKAEELAAAFHRTAVKGPMKF